MNPYMAYSVADNTVDGENKPKLLLKVYQSMLDKVEMVKSAIERKNFEKKYEELTKLTTAIEILDSSLDMSQGEIPQNLSGLYQYLVRRLSGVHISHDIEILDECRSILVQIHEGFTQAYEKERREKGEAQASPDQKNTAFSQRTI
jgi:flagellar secretion chaperone FliS